MIARTLVRVSTSLLVAASYVSAAAVQAEAHVPQPILLTTAPQPSDRLGQSVAVDGEFAAIGSASGSVRVLQHVAGEWVEEAELAAGGSSTFGTSVALSGDTLLVGAFNDATTVGASAGAAYVFRRDGGTWTQEAKLVPSGLAGGDAFGIAVALDGDRAAIGSSQDDHSGGQGRGSAYIFNRTGQAWSQGQKLIASDSADWDGFGGYVDLAGSVVAVGRPIPSGGAAGVVYVFEEQAGSWSEAAILEAPLPYVSHWFGISVAVANERVVVGTLENTDLDPFPIAWIYRQGTNGWELEGPLAQPQLEAPWDGAASYSRVAADEDWLAVGLPFDSSLQSHIDGVVAIFAFDGTAYSEHSVILPEASVASSFGRSTALDGPILFVGAPDENSSAGGAFAAELLPVGKWTDLGGALAGSVGEPRLDGEGTLLPGSPLTLTLQSAHPLSVAPLVFGVVELYAPFKGGTMIPDPIRILPFFTGFSGEVTISPTWPAGVPSGATALVQWWIEDDGALLGYAASNGLAATAP